MSSVPGPFCLPAPPTGWGPDSLFSLPQLYESALTENQKLKTKLQEAQLELADVKSKLEKMAQVRRGRGRGRGSQVSPPPPRDLVWGSHRVELKIGNGWSSGAFLAPEC